MREEGERRARADTTTERRGASSAARARRATRATHAPAMTQSSVLNGRANGAHAVFSAGVVASAAGAGAGGGGAAAEAGAASAAVASGGGVVVGGAAADAVCSFALTEPVEA